MRPPCAVTYSAWQYRSGSAWIKNRHLGETMLWGTQAVQEVQGQGSTALPCPDAYVYHFVAGA